MDDPVEYERRRRLAEINRTLHDFATGVTGEYATSDGTVYRRILSHDGDRLERVAPNGTKSVTPFTSELRDHFLAIARADTPSEIDAEFRRYTGQSLADIASRPKPN